MSETCEKLGVTHPIAALKSGLKNNWMKKIGSCEQTLKPPHWNNASLSFVPEITDN